MLAFFKTVLELFAYVAAIGIPLGLIIPAPAMTEPVNPVLWSVFLGVVFTFPVRAIVKTAFAWYRSKKVYYQTKNNIPPLSVEDAKRRGIITPLDFCLYMAAFQITPTFYADREPSFYAFVDGEMGVTTNTVFEEMFGRKPHSVFESNTKYILMTRDLKTVINVNKPRELWTLCIRAEAAKLANIAEEDVDAAVLQRYASKKIQPYAESLANVAMLTLQA